MSTESTIVLASGNAGKIDEINTMLRNTTYRVVAQGDLGISEAIEDKPTFIENALIKARHACAASGHPAIADDSGLAVDALGGQPGVLSARYSGEGANDEQNITKLLDKLEGVAQSDRTCQFVCAMVFLYHSDDASPIIAIGELKGMIHDRYQGTNGFGYDPVFWIPQMQCTMAELEPAAKNAISHRGKALRKLIDQLLTVRNTT